MSYKIKHKSAAVFRIAYIELGEAGRWKWFNLPALVFAVIAILFGVNLQAVFLVYIMYVFFTAIRSTGPRRTVFEIDLNRGKNLILIKTPDEHSEDAMVYPLNSFMGFGLNKLPPGKKKKSRPMADLFLIFDDTVTESFITSENSLLNRAEYVPGKNDHIFLQVPVRKHHHPTTLWSARKIIGTVDNWLATRDPGHAAETPPPEPEPEAEILRDFRDME